MEASNPPTADEINCLVPSGDQSWVQGFLQLPCQEHHGRLRVVEPVPALESVDTLTEPVRLVLQGRSAGTPACVASGFVSHFGFSVPVPPAFPLVVNVNEAIVGSDDPETRYPGATVQSDGMLDYFDEAEIPPDDLVSAGHLRTERISASFGEFDLKVFETAKAEFARASVDLSWSGEISLAGEERPLGDWADPLVRALALFAFCVDRPLLPERIFAPSQGREIDFHVRWQVAAAPTSTVRLLTEGRPDIPFADLAPKWADLWRGAKHLLNHVNAFQLRRDRLTLDDRVLVLVRSLELYHGYTDRLRSSFRKPSEHKKLRERILSALPDSLRRDHGAWIEGALNASNRKRLSEQVQEILGDLGDEVWAACAIDDPEKFASVVATTRNYFTHPKRKQPRDVPEGRGLFILVNRLWFVLRACVLVELGVSRPEIAAALRRSAQRHYLLRE